MDSGKHTEGFRGEWDGEVGYPVMGIKEGTYGNEHCVLYTQIMNHGTLHQKLVMYYMVTNIIKNKRGRDE